MEGYPQNLDDILARGRRQNGSQTPINVEERLQSDFVSNYSNASVGDGKIVVFRFEETPVMPTYLLAMSVTTFDHVKTTTEDGLVIR